MVGSGRSYELPLRHSYMYSKTIYWIGQVAARKRNIVILSWSCRSYVGLKRYNTISSYQHLLSICGYQPALRKLLSYPNLIYLDIQKQLTLWFKQTNWRSPRAKLADPWHQERLLPMRRTAGYPRGQSTEEALFLRVTTRLTRAHHKPHSWPCEPNWIRSWDAQESSMGALG